MSKTITTRFKDSATISSSVSQVCRDRSSNSPPQAGLSARLRTLPKRQRLDQPGSIQTRQRSATSGSIFLKSRTQENTVNKQRSLYSPVSKCLPERQAKKDSTPLYKDKYDLRDAATEKVLLKQETTSIPGGSDSEVRERKLVLPRFNSCASFSKVSSFVNGDQRIEMRMLERSLTSNQLISRQTDKTHIEKPLKRTNTMQTILLRQSGPLKRDTTGKFPPSKPSFKSLSNKVTGLIRAKNAFRRKSKVGVISSVAEEESEEDSFLISEMPTQPRFASMLSAEAQYAMMKGYEDIVYDKLTVTYPGCKTRLRRGKTPVSGIEVRPAGTESPPRRHCERTRTTSFSDSKPTTVDEQETPRSDSVQSETVKAPLPFFRKRSPSESSTTSTPASFDLRGGQRPDRRSQSMSSLAGPDKQLVMTYRYQSAMDLLDGLRRKDGVNTLSPRLKASVARGQHQPTVQEYNSWSRVWEHEFAPKVDV